MEDAMLLSAISALSAVVVYLYKLQMYENRESRARIEKYYRESLEKLDACEVKHDEAHKKIVELSEKVGKLAGIEHACEKLLNKIGDQINGQIQGGSQNQRD